MEKVENTDKNLILIEATINLYEENTIRIR